MNYTKYYINTYICNIFNLNINFQQNRVSRSVKTVHTNLFSNHRKLHKFVTCNSNFENSLLSDMNHLIFHI